MRITSAIFAILLPAMTLASCSTAPPEPAPTPQAPVVTAPRPAPPAAPTSGSWTDWPITPGGWVYRTDNRGSLALFGQANTDATFMIRCDRSEGKLFLSRAGAVSDGAKMTLRASSGLQSFRVYNSGGGAPYAAISVVSSEYMMDRIAFTRGRFAVETTGLPSLAIPIWAEFTRVVEDCRG